MFLMQHGRRQLEPGPVNEIAQGVGGEPHGESLAQTAGKPHQPVFAPSRDQAKGLREIPSVQCSYCYYDKEGRGRAALRAAPPPPLPHCQLAPHPTAEPASSGARCPVLLVLTRHRGSGDSQAPLTLADGNLVDLREITRRRPLREVINGSEGCVFHQFIVLRVGADPDPHDQLPFAATDSPIALIDSGRPEIIHQWLEMERRMKTVLLP